MGAPQLQYAIPAGGGVPVGVAGAGTVNRLTKWTAATTIGDSGISDDGATVSFVARNLASTALQTTWTLPSDASALTLGGVLTLNTSQKRLGINCAPGTLLSVSNGTVSAPSYDGIRLGNTAEALFSSTDSVLTFRAGVTGSTVVVGSASSHDLLLQRNNVTALTLGAAGAVTFAGDLTSSAAQTWTLAAGSTSALNIQSGLLNLDTSNSRVGVGTASPSAILHTLALSSAPEAGIFASANANSWIVFRRSTSTLLGYIGTGGLAAGGAAADMTFRSETGGLLFATGATERMRIDATGNVGIGTASPSSLGTNYATLDIRGSAGGGIRAGTPSIMSYMYADASGWNVATSTALPIIFYTNNTERARIDSSGNLILNTANTGATIQAAGTSQGLKLPATPGNADSQTLDCYQENPLATTAGNGWTPTLSAAATWGGTQPNVTYARYVRMGSMVFCEVKLTMGAGTMTSTYGLTTIDSPFTTNTNASHATVPVAAAGVSGVGFQTGTTVYLPTIGASTTFILSWSFFA